MLPTDVVGGSRLKQDSCGEKLAIHDQWQGDDSPFCLITGDLGSNLLMDNTFVP